mmetsp:Transcript_27056/g.65651  ORF Transcript_27056/g.65651 Transcript_27056/m.65651 type:complete len:965 (+) Transcript_27056:272-3166(+)|eukprot:CAMPEP_0113635674 /NCGR_PEP_ID=MMETSP0017_2-20120614/18598_1 /TAXON_ID=2856 /ORGANISM="Cylindrotheca closterium" /LENGTH=964 /DNA_ID=CAMNT_0000546469 /DNA_START=93 /DNA_END=2987 /DNA_ORIENTATION=+ /assembly_acc=CAM_ASM_000147
MMADPRLSPKETSPREHKQRPFQSLTLSPSGTAVSLSPKFTGRHSVLVALKKQKELQLDDIWATNNNEDGLGESLRSDFDITSIAHPGSRNMSGLSGFDSGLLNTSPVAAAGNNSRHRRSIMYTRADGSSAIADSSLLEQELKDMENRKNDISDSLLAFSLPEPFMMDNRPSYMSKKGRTPTANDLYGRDDSFRDDVSELMIDESEFFIGEEPESCRSLAHDDEDNSQTQSLYCDISVVKTSATDDQWAKYKLLGRVGMGEVRITKPAKKLVNKSIRVMAKSIKQVMALRESDPVIPNPEQTPAKPRSASCLLSPSSDNHSHVSRHTSFSSGTASTAGTTSTKADIFCSGKLLDEVKQTPLDILPPSKAQYKRDPKSIELPEAVKSQLKDYVTIIASMYTDNAFHNFEHASEVLKSSNAILSFISMSEELDDLDEGPGSGVITDPWTHFALVFSALIHDVDHSGVPNAQLSKEKSIIADSYKYKSVAEQNAIEIAWNLLMEPCYKDLREVLFTTVEEVSRFRRLVVIFVMATDIADQELAKFRKQRAQEAMSCQESSTVAASGKATFIMETIMQAADVSHTMQPFHVYKTWNWKLYREMYTAFENGRAEKDPTDTWFEADIQFFDFYVIPLAKQLVTCGVMDESKVENLLNNAIENRQEWEKHGERIVERYITDRSTPKREGKPQRRASMDSVSSGGSAMSDLTDCDDLSACSLLDTTFVKVSNSSLVEPQKPRSSRSGRPSKSKNQRRQSSKSPKKTRPSASSPKKTKKTKKKGKMVGPPPLLNDAEIDQAAEGAAVRKTKGKSSPQNTGESRKEKSQRRKSELVKRRHSVDSPRKGRSSKRKSELESSVRRSGMVARRQSAESPRKGRSKSELSPKRRSKKEDLVLTGPKHADPSRGEIVLPIRRNSPKRHARSKSSGPSDKEEVSIFLARFHASKEARTSGGRKRCNSASRATTRSSTTTS